MSSEAPAAAAPCRPKRRATAALAAPAIALGLALQACSSGSGGSDVGAHTGGAPTARAQVLNGGASDTLREGSEVLLTGKDSEDGDGPVIAWAWRQTGGPAVRLLEFSTTTVGFTAPRVSAPETLTFELTVEDTTADTASASVDLTVIPARDADRFLSLDVRGGTASFDTFKVVAALTGGARTGAAPKPFTLSVGAWLVYPPRTNPDAGCEFDPADFAAGMPESVASGCRVESLEDLTPEPLPGGGTGLEGEWPVGVDAPDEDAAARVARPWNPRFSLKIPRLDARELNQRFIDADERELLLDGFAVHRARVVLELRLTAPENQQDAELILTGLADDPVPLTGAPGGAADVIENGGTGLPTAAIVPLETLLAAVEGRETALTSEVYYRTVDPEGTRTTLNAWLAQAGFAADGDGTLLPDAVAGNGEFAHAVYVNNFDLGFGRDMYARVDELGNVFSFVRNHTTLEGAIRRLDPFVTVVMEYSPLSRHDAATPKFVKFFTYIEDGSGDERRVASFDFDGRGERFAPGNCTVCHGGARPPGVAELEFDAVCGDRGDAACYAWPAVNRDGDSIVDGNLDAMFLPWDLDSLLYADTDPAITRAPVPFDGVPLSDELARDYGDFTRDGQAAQLKKLNETAYATYADGERTAAARLLVEQWYGGVDEDGRLIGDTFDDSTPVPGWRNDELVPDPNPRAGGALVANPPNAAGLYGDVHARHCRMCHTNMLDGTLRFATYREFVAQQDAIAELVFRSGIMPGARLTMDRFWAPFSGGVAPGALLAEHFAALTGEEPAPAPGPAVAEIAGLEPAPRRGDTVYLGGAGSAFADSYAWSLSAPAGSAATLVGAATAHAMFVADAPGAYEVTLSVNAGTDNEAATTTTQEIANRAPAAANDLYDLELADSGALQASVLAGGRQDADPDGDALTASPVAGAAPSHGTVVLDADGSFMYTYTGDTTAAPASDSFAYAIDDGFGGAAQATATILLHARPAAERPTAPDGLSAVDASTAAGAASVFAVALRWLASSDDVGAEGYNVYRDGALLDSFASTAAAGSAVTYTDSAVAPDTAYTYRVTAIDADGQSALSNEAHVEVTPSLRQNIQTGWGAGPEALWGPAGCIGCHAGAAGGLTLRGAADEVYAELTEDAGQPGRHRLEPAAPSQSLLLCKPLLATHPEDCAHGGGDFFVVSDPAYRMLLRWIEHGAPDN